MDFTLSKQHEMARQLFKDFAENEVKPLAQETDETEAFPQVTVDKMGKSGFLGIPVPKEYGGQGADILTYIMCVEELSKVCGTTGVVVSAHTSLCVDPILTYGTEDQKQKFLPDLCSGKKLGAFGLTEPAQVQMLRVFRQRLFRMKQLVSGSQMVLSASLQTVKLLMFISSLLIQMLSKTREAEKLRNSLHLS